MAVCDKLVHWAKEMLCIVIKIVRKQEDRRGLRVLPCRCVVERTYWWIRKCRRLTRDYARRVAHSEAMVHRG